MLVTSGKYKGKTLELVTLKNPYFIKGLLSRETKDKKLMLMQAEARRLIVAFNRRAFNGRCMGRNCSQPATRCSIYKSDVFNPKWWCDICDPWQYGAGKCLIQIVRTYQDAIAFGEPFDDPTVAEDLVRVLAEAKGLSSRLGKDQADVFFNG